jgi:thiol-disulfide isomerase/thioredoxin
MKPFFALLLLLMSAPLLAQQVDTLTPAYQRYPNLPPFEILQSDSSLFTRENLSKKKPVIIMYFSPDCGHCQHQTQYMIEEMEAFKSFEIVMTTYQPWHMMKQFYQDYRLRQYPNIHLGRDTKFFFPPFFKIANLPFIALYDRKHQLVMAREGNITIEKLQKEMERAENKN